MSDRRPGRIARSHYEIDLARYHRDFAIDFGGFLVGFLWLLHAQHPLAIAAAYVLATVSLHRASIFGHDIVHHFHDPRLRRFRLLWDHTVGAVCLAPVVRFKRPHQVHHSPGLFRTQIDPQYLTLRRDPRLALSVLVLAPVVMPLVGLAQALIAAFGGVRAEAAMADLFERRGLNPANVPEPAYRAQVVARSRVYVAMLAALAILAPQALLPLYAVLVGGWLLLTLRVPLEHGLEEMLDRRSDWNDQLIDSYTIESPLADLLQPHGMKYHTAHHLYPGVPYHNLARLHAELKAADPVYRESVITLWDAIRGPALGRTLEA
ncbi:fatty acid desaturase [Albimonas sp. CAU 1670]|uniref:fatty acid desaturase n=1 Tax=Albimonas sp. CAU 1670 TaxID=3032599 RepID=UPI0023D98FA4|nr:fatty acid desaturase [Albimonas sp. CAU 1670]MDF2234815.1 fatty acid desaturase [Albimonas sp. CAU 1670]